MAYKHDEANDYTVKVNEVDSRINADADLYGCLDLELVVPAFLRNQQSLAEEERIVNVSQSTVKLVLQNTLRHENTNKILLIMNWVSPTL